MGMRNPVYMAFKINKSLEGDRLLDVLYELWFNGNSKPLTKLLREIEAECKFDKLFYLTDEFLRSTAAYFEGFRQSYFNIHTREIAFAGASESDSLEYRRFLSFNLNAISPIHEDVFGFCSFDGNNNQIIYFTEKNLKYNNPTVLNLHIDSNGQVYSPQRIMRLKMEPEYSLDLSTKEDDFLDWEVRDNLDGFLDLLVTAIELNDLDLAQEVMTLFDGVLKRDFNQQDLLRSKFSDKYFLKTYKYPSDAKLREVTDFLKSVKLSEWKTWLPNLLNK